MSSGLQLQIKLHQNDISRILIRVACTNRCDNTMLWLKCESLIHIKNPEESSFQSTLYKKMQKPTKHTEMTELFTKRVLHCRTMLLRNLKQPDADYQVSVIQIQRVTRCLLDADGKAVVYRLLLYTSAFLEATCFFSPAGSAVSGEKHRWCWEGKEVI